MADCPYCDEWCYDPTGACLGAYPVGSRVAPIVWDGTLRVASGSEAPNGRHMATGWHICTAHTFEPDVLLLGPWEEYAPLAEINAVLTAMADAPLRTLLFGANSRR